MQTDTQFKCSQCGETDPTQQSSKAAHWCKACNRLRTAIDNPTINAVSARAYAMCGGEKTFYKMDKEDRITVRDAARHQLEVLGEVIPFPKVHVPQEPRVTTTKVTTRPGAARFRRLVLKRDKQCVITGVPVGTFLYSKGKRKSILEAAHIVPHNMCKLGEYDDPNNGLTMTAAMHADFDTAMFTIGSNGQILPSRWVPEGYYPPYISLPTMTPEMSEYIARHRAWAFKNWNRWAFT